MAAEARQDSASTRPEYEPSGPVYLDNQATTRVDPRVVEAMLPALTDAFGNAGSRTHVYGRDASAAVEVARTQVAELISAEPAEVIFTSGATESNNLALLGIARGMGGRRRKIVTQNTEHKSVLDACSKLERDGFQVIRLRVNEEGLVDPSAVAAVIDQDTALVSIMWANNEIGVVQDVVAIGDLCRSVGVPFHTDAVQAAATEPIDVSTLPIDLLSISAHKIYGPKGVGALYVRRESKLRIEPLLHGGGQERGLRSGTLPVHQIVGLGMACELAANAIVAGEVDRIRLLRDRFIDALIGGLSDVVVNGSKARRLVGNANLWFRGCDAEALIMRTPDIAFSTGSACTSTSLDPSHVLLALDGNEQRATESARFSFGRFSTSTDVETAVHALTSSVATLRRLAPSSRHRTHSL